MKPARTTSQNQSPEQQRYMSEQNAKVLAGNVSFGSTATNTGQDQNIERWLATGTTDGADTEFSITHQLGRIPIGIIVIRTNKAGVFYDSGTTWTKTTIFLKCNTATVTFTLLVI